MAPELTAEGIIPKAGRVGPLQPQALTDAVEAGLARQREVVPRVDTLVFLNGKAGVLYRAKNS